MNDQPSEAGPQHAPSERRESASARAPSARWFAATLVVAIAAVTIVVLTWWQEGTASAIRAATECVMPLGLLWWVIAWSGLAAWWGGRRALATSFASVWLAITLLGNGWLATLSMEPIESPPITRPTADHTPLRTVVVLGGGVSTAPNGEPEVNRDGQRVISAAQLWHAGRTRSIICTGTSSNRMMDPSEAGRQLLVSLGIPSDAIFEIAGRNTVEEMASLQAFLETPPEGFPREGKVGLITSAFHMHRAMRLARRQGLALEPWPCSFRVGEPAPFSAADVIPRSGAAELLSLSLKERLARLVGR